MRADGNLAATARLYFAEHGTGLPLLLIHGLMVTGDMFEPVLGALEKRRRLIVPDLRGSGRSRTLPPPYKVEQQAADLARLLESLGIEKADVLGYSQGGAVAQQFALDHSAHVRRLVLSNTYAHNAATFREKLESRLLPFLVRLLGLERFARLVVSLGLSRVSKERAGWVVSLIADQDPRLMIIAWKEAMAFDSRSLLGKIACPTLVIAGEKDNGVPIHHAEMLHKGIPGSKLVVVDGADHALIWSHPDDFARVVTEFLDAP
jgi:pimeloyl-ACP methyl ester carboxylesterase